MLFSVKNDGIFDENGLFWPKKVEFWRIKLLNSTHLWILFYQQVQF